MRLAFLLVIVSLMPACRRESPTAAAPEVPADAVAVVGRTPLLRTDLEFASANAGNLPLSSVVATLADEEALAQLALAEGLGSDPSVRAAIRRMLSARLQERHLSEIKISDEELAAAGTAAAVRPLPPQLHLAFLRQRFDEAGGEAAAVAKLEKARDAWQALSTNAPRNAFGPLAVEFSDDQDTRYQGGDAGWIQAGESHLLLPPEVTQAAAPVRASGLLPEIVRAGGAAWLVLVVEVRAARGSVAGPEVLRAGLAAAGEKAAKEALLQRARAAAPVTILIPAGDSPVPPRVPVPPKLP